MEDLKQKKQFINFQISILKKDKSKLILGYSLFK